MTFTVANLVPSLLDIHADAQNAAVLATRARWSGVESTVVDLASAGDAAGVQPDAITIGAGFDADAAEVLTALGSFTRRLHEWIDSGVPLVAVGLGWDLLSASVELTEGVHTPGLGIFPGRSVQSPRVVGTIAVDSAWGRLVGYEYHLRDYIFGAGEKPLGTVVRGVGNLVAPADSGPEGAEIGNVFGTGIRGPVLARNPQLADEVLTRAFARTGATYAPADSDVRRAADEHARKANDIVLSDMKLP